MSIVSKHLEKLLAQRGTPLWGGYVNMLKTLESVFLSPKHWGLEFIQNAEDATAESFSIRLGQDSLWILNNGNVFDGDDFYTICDVNSRKLPSLGFRGYIGIGFKSIFRITDRIDIHSDVFHFKFDKRHWDDSRRNGTPISKWPWEILPVELKPEVLPEGYNTGFYIPLESKKSKEVLQEIGKFLSSSDFPKEAILLLKNIKVIEVQTPQLSFTITKVPKETKESKTFLTEKMGIKELVLIRKQVRGRKDPEKSHYLVFRKTVKIPPDIRQDEETERVRRSEVLEREIGLVFGSDSEENLHSLSGKLAGVYSFLPVEGEQTGLPFGIFGDFIPQPGRDLINYEAKWNQWMCNEVVGFFKEVVQKAFSPHPRWKLFIAELLGQLQYSSVQSPGKEFWETNLRNPIIKFLESEALYSDSKGQNQKLDELMTVDEDIVRCIGSNVLENVFKKKIAGPHIEIKIKNHSKVTKIGTYNTLSKKELLESLKNHPKKLATCYQFIKRLNDYYIRDIRSKDGKNISLSSAAFVLAEDNAFYLPGRVMVLEMDLDSVPRFLMITVPEEKKLLHPVIAKDSQAIEQLRRCGLEVVNKQSVISKLQNILKKTTTPDLRPKSWKYPDDLIQATLFLILQEGGFTIERLVAQDGTLQASGNLFVPKASLDWIPLWRAGLLPGFQPIHKNYLNKESLEKARQCFEKSGVHGFQKDKDNSLIETAAYEITKKKLTDEGHKIVPVTERHKLGYDLQCQGHCEKVFEVKGMADPHDITLKDSACTAAQQKKGDYVLVCVYNLPTQTDKVGYKEIPNPINIWEPVEQARVPKDKWIST